MPLRPLLLLALALSACSIDPPAGTAPLPSAQSAGSPVTTDERDFQTPDSVPPGFASPDPMAGTTGVIGVTHAVP